MMILKMKIGQWQWRQKNGGNSDTQNNKVEASEMAHQIKALTAKPDDLSSNLMKWKKRTNSCKQSPNLFIGTLTCICPSPHNYNKNLKVEGEVI